LRDNPFNVFTMIKPFNFLLAKLYEYQLKTDDSPNYGIITYISLVQCTLLFTFFLLIKGILQNNQVNFDNGLLKTFIFMIQLSLIYVNYRYYIKKRKIHQLKEQYAGSKINKVNLYLFTVLVPAALLSIGWLISTLVL